MTTIDGRCSRHKGVPSSLLCSRCGDTICPKCMTVSPVGYRCPDCSRYIKIPTYNLSKELLVKVLIITIFCGLLVGGILFVFALSLRASSLPTYLNYYLFMASIGISGFFIGETVSLTSNRRRGRTLKYISFIGVLTSDFYQFQYANCSGNSPIRSFYSCLVINMDACHIVQTYNEVTRNSLQ